MIEEAGVRFNNGDYYHLKVDTDVPECSVVGTINGEAVDLTGGSGGITNVVLGDFTVPSTSGVKEFEIPYDGEGFPTQVLIWADDITQIYGSRGGRALWGISKLNTNPPTYNDTSSPDNKAINSVLYHKTDTIYDDDGSTNSPMYDIGDPNTYQLGSIRIHDNKTIKYYAVDNGSNGFVKNTKYNYMILYSE